MVHRLTEFFAMDPSDYSMAYTCPHFENDHIEVTKDSFTVQHKATVICVPNKSHIVSTGNFLS